MNEIAQIGKKKGTQHRDSLAEERKEIDKKNTKEIKIASQKLRLNVKTQQDTPPNKKPPSKLINERIHNSH